MVETLNLSNSLNLCNVSVMTDDLQKWEPPPIDVVKLNCDGSVKNNGREAGCGGVLRDSYGRVIFAFSHKLDACSVIEAELWSIYHGLSLIAGRGFTKVIVETDSTMALDLIERGGSSDDAIHLLISGILEIGKNGIDVGWSRVNREFNVAADSLADCSYKIKDMNVIFDIVPDFLVHVISKDSIGLASPSMN